MTKPEMNAGKLKLIKAKAKSSEDNDAPPLEPLAGGYCNPMAIRVSMLVVCLLRA